MEPLLWCEEFAVQHLWKSGYSTGVFGPIDRPPLHELCNKLCELCQYLSDNVEKSPQPLHRILSNFVESDPTAWISAWTQSSPVATGSAKVPETLLRECRGLLRDLYRIVIARRLSYDGWAADPHTSNTTDGRTQHFFSEFTMFPGSDSLRLGKLVMDPEDAKKVIGSLDDLTASFIQSGPFSIELTTTPSQHLVLNKRGRIMVFWEGPEIFQTRFGIPGCDSFRRPCAGKTP